MTTILALTLALQGTQAPRVPVSIEEYLSLARFSAIEVSPDGSAVSFTTAETGRAANEQRARLYLWRAGDGVRPVVGAFGDVERARWSQDGRSLAFISASAYAATPEDARPQIWVLAVRDGARASRASQLTGRPIDLAWGPDGSIYTLTAGESDDRREFWILDVADGSAEFIWGGGRGIRDMALSPDGRLIAFSRLAADGSSYDLAVLDLESRRVRSLTGRPASEVAPRWSPDGSSVVFRAPQNPQLAGSQTELFRVSAGGGTPQSLTGSFDRTVIDHRWPAGGELTFTAALGPYTHLFVLRENGAIEALTSGPFNYGTFDADSTGARIYAARESADEAQELWRIGGPAERLTYLNSRSERWERGRQQIVRWTAPDGLSVEGLLVHPADYRPGQRYPLLVNVGAGPSQRIRDALDQRHGYQLFAARGYAIFAPNMRGVPGYGERFGTASRRDVAGGDFVDVMAGIDHVVGMGFVDASRIAIYGDGYGALLVDWSLTQTPRFAAALSMHGASVSSAMPASLNASLLRGFEEEIARAAIALANNVQTPLLLLESAQASSATPAAQLYRALRELDRPVEYASYGHDTANGPRARADVYLRQLRWFDKHLKFGGADKFDFYLLSEWAPGADGWKLQVTNVETRLAYSDTAPTSGRYLQVTLTVQPDTASLDAGTIGGLQLDLRDDVRLVSSDRTARPPAGTVSDQFGIARLLPGATGTTSRPLPAAGPPTGLITTLAFEIPEAADEYRLEVAGFGSVRIWVDER